jgi:hypothetical protein
MRPKKSRLNKKLKIKFNKMLISIAVLPLKVNLKLLKHNFPLMNLKHKNQNVKRNLKPKNNQ